ncbi:MAG: nitroreductase [Lachnospiraceae bacterium]|nr:nitroreductase [Lachnospiraceae bacterium]
MNETIKTLTTRRSPRAFRPEHVSKEDIQEIIAAGLNAPSGMNSQSPRFVVVQDDAMVQKLSKMNAAVMGMPADPFYGAPDVIVVLAVKQMTYIYDGSLAMGNLLNAAWSKGIDSRWIHRAKEVFESEEGKQLLKEWGITEDVEGIGFCILGYAAEEKSPKEIKEGRVYYVS